MQTWDKQLEETGRAYNAFLTYRNMGVLRSLKKAAGIFYNVENISETSGKVRTFTKWSSEYKWVTRCSDFDIEEERLRIEQKRALINKMNEEQAKDGAELRRIGMTNIKLHAGGRAYEIDEKGKRIRIKPMIPLPESIKLNTEGVKEQRVAVGEVTEISEHKGELNIKVIEVDDEIAKKALDEIAKRKIRNTGTTSTEA